MLTPPNFVETKWEPQESNLKVYFFLDDILDDIFDIYPIHDSFQVQSFPLCIIPKKI